MSFGTTVLQHDCIRRMHVRMHTGELSQMGARRIIMSGITTGYYGIVASRAVIIKDVPFRCIMVGNSAKVLREGVDTVGCERLAKFENGRL